MRLGSDIRDNEDKVLVTMKEGEEGMKCKGVLLEGQWRGGEEKGKERKGEEPGGKEISLHIYYHRQMNSLHDSFIEISKPLSTSVYGTKPV